MSANIIIIDDEADLCELVEYNLGRAGFSVTSFLDTRRVEQFLDEEEVDIIIMDRNLGGVEGAKFIKNLRQKGYNEPVIFLTAKNLPKDKLEGFENGGDDYITKPFEMDELIARINALLKRTKKQEEIYKFKNITLNVSEAKVSVDSENIALTKLEFALLLELIKNKSILLNRQNLAADIWGDENTSQKTINIAIKRLRQKLGNAGKMIQSVRGEGYKIC